MFFLICIQLAYTGTMAYQQQKVVIRLQLQSTQKQNTVKQKLHKLD